MARVDTADIKRISDPFQRVLAVDNVLQDVRQIIAELKWIRVDALRELVRTRGGASTAELLHIPRARLYWAIREGDKGKKPR